MLFDLYQSQILIIDSYVLIPAVVAQVFNPIAELVISAGISTKSRNGYTSSNCKSANKKIFIIIQSRTNLSVLLTHQFILLCFLNKIISCFSYVFQCTFLTYIFFSHILKKLLYLIMIYRPWRAVDLACWVCLYFSFVYLCVFHCILLF